MCRAACTCLLVHPVWLAAHAGKLPALCEPTRSAVLEKQHAHVFQCCGVASSPLQTCSRQSTAQCAMHTNMYTLTRTYVYPRTHTRTCPHMEHISAAREAHKQGHTHPSAHTPAQACTYAITHSRMQEWHEPVAMVLVLGPHVADSLSRWCLSI